MGRPGTKKFPCPAVPLSRDKKKIIVQLSLCPGTRAAAKIPRQTPLSRDVPGQKHYIKISKISCFRTSFSCFLFFWESDFVPGQRSLSRDFCCCSFFDSGTRTLFCPRQRDNETSRPWLSRGVPSLGNPTLYLIIILKTLLLLLTLINKWKADQCASSLTLVPPLSKKEFHSSHSLYVVEILRGYKNHGYS